MTPPPAILHAEYPYRGQSLTASLSGFLRSIQKPAHLLVAISGGSDSTGLLIGLSSLLPSFPDIRLSAATIDHALRPEAAEEARAVARLCAQLDVVHVTRRWDNEKPATGLSAAAREARYSLLSQIAEACGATAIVTGHTLDDQIETIVMRAGRSGEAVAGRAGVGAQPVSSSRGDADGRTGPGSPFNDMTCYTQVSSPGLSGMGPATLLDARHWILRPLLHTRRADIRAWLTDHGYGWIDDPSNVDPHYERVRIRQTLASDSTGIDLGGIAAAGQARAHLAQAAADWLADHAAVEHAVIARIAPGGLSEDPAVLRHALATLAAVLGGRAHMMSRENADRLMTFLTSGTHGRMTAGRVVFDRRRDGLYMLRENRNLPNVTVQPDRAVIWDARFFIANHSQLPFEVSPGNSDVGRFANVPPALAKLAARVSPHVANQHETDVVVMPRLALFDHFLPVFDLPLASRIASLMGRDRYLLPPV